MMVAEDKQARFPARPFLPPNYAPPPPPSSCHSPSPPWPCSPHSHGPPNRQSLSIVSPLLPPLPLYRKQSPVSYIQLVQNARSSATFVYSPHPRIPPNLPSLPS